MATFFVRGLLFWIRNLQPTLVSIFPTQFKGNLRLTERHDGKDGLWMLVEF